MAAPGAGNGRARPPPSSPLHSFPSPFAETNVTSVQELLQRTYPLEPGATGSTPLGRIGVAYTPTAAGLSMAALVTRLKDGAPRFKSGADVNPLLISSGVSAAPASAAKAAPGGSGAPASPAGTPSRGRGPALSPYPKAIPTVVVPRRGISATKLTPLSPRAGGEVADAATPASPALSSTDAAMQRIRRDVAIQNESIEAEIKKRYAFDERTLGAVLAHEQRVYWATVDRMAPDTSVADHKPAWEAGIIRRLAASAASTLNSNNAPMPRWKDPSLLVPQYIAAKYGLGPFTPPPPSVSPAALVEYMFGEVARVYLQAVKRSMLDYDLRCPDANKHHGLTLHLVDSLRYVPPPATARASLGVSYLAAPSSAVQLLRSLRVTERVMQRLNDLWLTGRVRLTQASDASGSGGGGPGGALGHTFAETRLARFTTPEFFAKLPMTIEDFSAHVQSQIDNAIAVLRGQWHKESAELVAAFVLELEDATSKYNAAEEAIASAAAAAAAAAASPANGGTRRPAAPASPTASASLSSAEASALAAGGKGGEAAGKGEEGAPSFGPVPDPNGAAAIRAVDPQSKDLVRYAVGLMRAHLWYAGWAPGQEEDPSAYVVEQYINEWEYKNGGEVPPLAAFVDLEAVEAEAVAIVAAAKARRWGGGGATGAASASFAVGSPVRAAMSLPKRTASSVAAGLDGSTAAGGLPGLPPPRTLPVLARGTYVADPVVAALGQLTSGETPVELPAGVAQGAEGGAAAAGAAAPASPTRAGSPSRTLGAGATMAATKTTNGGVPLPLDAAAVLRALPPLHQLARLSPVQMRKLAEHIAATLERREAQGAARLYQALSAAASLMARCLREVVYAGLRDITALLATYALPEDAAAAIATQVPAPGEDLSAVTTFVEASTPPAAPLFKVNLAIFYGEGSSQAGLDLVVKPDAAALESSRARTASAGAGKGRGSSAAPGGSSGRPASAKDGKGGKTPAQVEAETTLEDAGGPEPVPTPYPAGDDLSRLWAGSVAFVYDPGWEALEAGLMRQVESMVTAGCNFPRVEADIAAASGISALVADMGARAAAAAGINTAGNLANNTNSMIAAPGTSAAGGESVGEGSIGDEDGEVATPGTSAAVRPATLVEAMTIPGTLASVTLGDGAVEGALGLMSAVVEASKAGPEELRARFDRFRYLFGGEEKARLLTIAHSPSTNIKDVARVVAETDELLAAIDATCEDTVVFTLVSVDAAPLKQALKSRARLLMTLFFRHLKAQLVHLCEVLNVRYRRISRRLQHHPESSEELVVLHAYEQGLEAELRSLERLMYGPTGVSDLLRVVYADGVSREYLRAAPGAEDAAGPPGVMDAYGGPVSPGGRAGTPGSPAGGRVGTPSGGSRASMSLRGMSMAALIGGDTGMAGDVEGLALTRPQTQILRQALGWPDKVKDDLQACRSVLELEKTALITRLAARVADFQKEMGEVAALIDKLVGEGTLSRLAATNNLIASLRRRIEAGTAEAEAINGQQELLGVAIEDYSESLKEAAARLAPFEKMWGCITEYQAASARWYDAPLLSNNADESIKEGESLRVTAAKVLRELPEDATVPRNLLSKVKEDLEHFIATDHPLLALLANPGLKDRHWAQMEGAVGFSIPHSNNSTLADMLELQLETHVAVIEEFCVNASKEYSLERALDRMESEWQPIHIDLKAHGGSGTYILTGASSEEIQALLDDHVVKSSTMAASRYAKALEGRIKGWVAALTEIQLVLDVWLKVQSTWLYLAPIFSSEDIMLQMPVEGSRFKIVDATWRAMMKGAVADPLALRALRQPGMLTKLTEAHELLELILKGLNEYLEQKRLIFPRFFFLSNDELLEILAETKDPLRVQPHLRKAFEGINALQFSDKMDIEAMISAEGEKITYTPAPDAGGRLINPADARGNVELWLLQVEAAMKRATARTIDEACRSYPAAPSRGRWAMDWAGQAVLAVTQTYWTSEVETALREKSMKAYAKKCTSQIEELVLLVRGKLSSLARKTLSALVVIDVHARDVTQQMADTGVAEPSDFEWNSQLRYYWVDDGYSAASGLPGSLTMKMINASLKYGYEYLGNTTRLVITPLTDRCYRTLMGAVHLGLGGAPEGPAGTGKTETTKDLSKAAAFQCVVFNCSDGLDYLAMAKFFKGLAASGAWACFDEFNRIELEVLSVIAQQILTIQVAVKSKQPRFVFEGTELQLNPTCSVFITMNPGYAGRSELPDNLKALFRSVAMMVPDYRLISEIILFSNGYLQARALATKIVATYKLCSEQLSSQGHYDYGMRAVVAVLRAAGNLKRTDGDLPEDVLVLRSIIDVNLPKFLQPDVPLFNAIVKDLFPGVTVPPPDRKLLMDAFTYAAFELQVQPVPNLLEKTLQVYEMMIVRHGFMLVGQPFSGKSTAANVLRLAMNKLHEDLPDDARWATIHHVRLNPKSISSGALYGRFDELTHEWTDGVLAVKYRDCAQSKIGRPEDRKWLIFDGPVDAVWIENMNTVLDDNKKLCLTSGEIIAMTDVMSMVFEVGDLAAASPATVSRCGMIYMEPQLLGWQPLLSSWLEHRAEDNPRFPFKAARPSNPESRAREEREEKEWFEAAEKAAAEEAAGGAKRSKRSGKGTMVNDTRTFTLDAVQAAQLAGLFNWLVEPCLVLLRRQGLAEFCPTQDAMLVNTLIRTLDCLLSQLVSSTRDEVNPGYHIGTVHVKGRAEPTPQDLECMFLFALVWSLGATVTPAGRSALTEFIQTAVREPAFLNEHALKPFYAARGWVAPGTPKAPAGEGEEAPPAKAGPPNPYDKENCTLAYAIPQKGLIHDFFYSATENRWREWTSAMSKADIPATAQYADIVVPTVYTVQFEYLVQLLLSHKESVLVCGPTGTGKSQYMKQMLLQTLPRDKYMPVFVAFSARTSAAASQAMIDVKLDRRRKGVFGPPAGQTCVVFVDDLNLPEEEKYGAQPPLELLRQLADDGGWYDLVENEFKTIEDSVLAMAMGPPGGGRNFVSPRLLRHARILCFPDLDDATLSHIFGTVMEWFLGKTKLPADAARLGPSIVAATLDLYKAASSGLLPTPAKSHYTFNLRDFSRVIEGVFLVTPDAIANGGAFTRLWVHEATRVFHDRLVDDADRTWVVNQLRELVRKHFAQDFDKLCEYLVPLAAAATGVPEPPAGTKVTLTPEHLRAMLWIDYGQFGKAGNGPAAKGYSEVSSITLMSERLDAALVEHNGTSKKPLDLVMFLFFLEHVTRAARVLKMPGGHALLVGVGGSGRRCAARLAAFVSECSVAEVELSKSYGNTEWRDDLKRILREAGTAPTPVVFMFADTQIKWEGMLEDINAVLNSGEVPGLYAPDERAEICEKIGPLARAAGLGRDASPAELYAFFVTRVKRNLHVVLCMSPVGDAFRDRLRKFPSLVNCCTIDWYTSWPRDALSAVALKGLKGLPGFEGPLLTAVVDACQHFHRSSFTISADFLAQQRRHTYVTPTAYLELLSTFKRFLEIKRKEVAASRQRYQAGLEKLQFATLQVNEMQRELEALQPSLQQSQKETASLMEVIKERLPGVEATRTTVSAEAAIANAEAEAVSKVSKECADDLAVAMPVLESALKALDTISPSDISSVKSMQKPPENVRMVMAAVCVMLGEKPEKIADPANPTKKIEDYWTASKKVLSDMKFIDRLKNYDLNHIDAKIIAVIRATYLTNPNFKPEIVAKSSSAAEGLCRWVMAMDQYERVAKEVAPKQAALAEAESKLEVTMAELAKKQGALKAVEDELATLQRQLAEAERKKDELERQVDLCGKKLTRAEQLLSGLGGEKTRWSAMSRELSIKYTNLTGDVLLASGMIAYLGAFTRDFRKRALDDWLDKCVELDIPCVASPAPPMEGDEEAAAAEAAEGGGSKKVSYSLAATLGEPLLIRQWQIDGLPTDAYSTESAIICSGARRWPLMVDPQGQANKWVKNMERANGLLVVKLSDSNFLRNLENAIQFGRPVLLENVGEELDPALEPILLRVVFKQGGIMCIRLGDATVEYDERFKLYITTKLPNPHYLPEVSTKVTLVNFMITPEGLTDQLLGTVVAQERPDLQEQKNQLILQSAENQRQLKDIENRILHVLSSSEGNILEDETAIQVLNSSKELANVISEKQRVAQQTEAAIDEARAGYTPVAQHSSRLFFCIASMGAIDAMYIFSLDWFSALFISAMQNSEKSPDLATRITNLNDYFTYSMFKNVCRSLFERHKLLYSFLLTLTIMDGRGEIDPAEQFFLFTGGVAADNPHPNPAPAWLTDRAWGEIVRLSTSCTAFDGFFADFASSHAAWKKVYDSEQPRNEKFPGRWGAMGALTRLQKLLVLRCLRPDRLVPAITDFIVGSIGKPFTIPPPFDLRSCYEDSSPQRPLVFILSPGSDPMASLLYFAEQQGVKVHSISLGQGQGPIAEAMVERAKAEGGWVVLQNCHLATSWMPRLETLAEQLMVTPTAGSPAADAAAAAAAAGTPAGSDAPAAAAVTPLHPNFRLWLTSYPSESFPVSILQSGIKMTDEPPMGMRENIKRSFLSDPISDPGFFGSVSEDRADTFRRLLFALTFFHALVLERRSFGPLGFNIPYQFTESDLRISARQLAMFVDDPSYGAAAVAAAAAAGGPDAEAAARADPGLAVPWKHLRYLTGECNYGGRVTDDMDRRALMSQLAQFYSPDVLRAGVPITASPEFVMPGAAVATHAEYLTFIDSLPAVATCEVFGLHDNAAISRDIQQANDLLDCAMLTLRDSSSSKKDDEEDEEDAAGEDDAKKEEASAKRALTREETITEVAGDILSKITSEFDLEAVELKYPNDPKESMNTLLYQELARFNRLLSIIRSTMKDVRLGMEGLIVMSSSLEGVANELFLGKVPTLWKGRSYPSRKPLASYVADLVKRLDFFNAWIANGKPPAYWLPGFFFTQSFLTAVSQNYARKYVIPIDELAFDLQMLAVQPSALSAPGAEPPSDGAYIYGTFLDGCRWDGARGVLGESEPRQLFAPAPAMWLLPVRASELRSFPHYVTPVYRTTERRGTLSTTGHSTNFVMHIRMPSDKPADVWIRRGVAMVLALDD